MDDVLDKIDMLGLDDLSGGLFDEESYGKEIIMPRGIKVAYPLKGRDVILQGANELTTKYIGTKDDVFKKENHETDSEVFPYLNVVAPVETKGEYKKLYELIRQKTPTISEKIQEQYAAYFESLVHMFGYPEKIDPSGNIYGKLWEHFNFENSAFELHEPILDYRPLDVKVSTDTISVTDLYSGQQFSKRRIRHPELNGFTSLDAPGMDHTVPNAIEILGHTNKHGRSIKITEKTIVRTPCGKGNVSWYFPLWEIPVVNRRTAYDYETVAIMCNLDKVMECQYFWKDSPDYFWKNFDEDNPKKREYIWKHSVPFVTTGALFFDSFFGKLVDAAKSGSCFDEQNPSGDKLKYKAEIEKSRNTQNRSFMRRWVFYGNLRGQKEKNRYLSTLERNWFPNIREFESKSLEREMKVKFGWSWKKKTEEYIAQLKREMYEETRAEIKEFENKLASIEMGL